MQQYCYRDSRIKNRSFKISHSTSQIRSELPCFRSKSHGGYCSQESVSDGATESYLYKVSLITLTMDSRLAGVKGADVYLARPLCLVWADLGVGLWFISPERDGIKIGPDLHNQGPGQLSTEGIEAGLNPAITDITRTCRVSPRRPIVSLLSPQSGIEAIIRSCWLGIF